MRGLALAGVVLAVLALRVVLASRAELQRADQLRSEQQLDAAIVHYRRAARWYAPANPYSTRALDRLARLARSAQDGGNEDRALSAWRAVRSSIMATRSFYVPHGERLRQANERIARLMAAKGPPPVDRGKSEEQLRAEHLDLLRSTDRPHPGWTLLVLLGFAAWVGGAFAFASWAIDEEDRLVRPTAVRWGLVILAGFAMFVTGLLLA
jgi:hypothetical protein